MAAARDRAAGVARGARQPQHLLGRRGAVGVGEADEVRIRAPEGLGDDAALAEPRVLDEPHAPVLGAVVADDVCGAVAAGVEGHDEADVGIRAVRLYASSVRPIRSSSLWAGNTMSRRMKSSNAWSGSGKSRARDAGPRPPAGRLQKGERRRDRGDRRGRRSTQLTRPTPRPCARDESCDRSHRRDVSGQQAV